MADRTHSHDTTTPAMSAETVPSEEFVLVPREPTREMFVAMTWGFNVYGGLPGAYRAVIEKFAAAPTLSASHLAKEGGEAGAAAPPAKLAHRIVLHCQNTPPEEAIEIAERLIVTALNHPMNVPQPSPALAKGGDAVREALRGLESAATKVVDSYGWTASDWDDLSAALEVARVALSTPTEGPASQTEGMGGDAVREAFRAGWKVNAVGTDVHPQEYLDGCEEVDWEDYAARAALTPPETAEAVPVASDPAPATDDRERLVEALREAAVPFVRHYADWMNRWPDDQEVSVSPRHTYGEIRALRAALATEASR